MAHSGYRPRCFSLKFISPCFADMMFDGYIIFYWTILLFFASYVLYFSCILVHINQNSKTQCRRHDQHNSAHDAYTRQFKCTSILLNAGYSVDVREDDDNHWTNLTSIAGGFSYVVKELRKGTHYRFRVRAENKFGVGEPAETNVIIAKDPYGIQSLTDI